MRNIPTIAALALLLGLGLAPAHAQSSHQGHSMPAKPATGVSPSADNASTRAYKASSMKMHADMDIAYSGNSDVDFLNGMIPHHQGAVDMAKVALAHAADPEVKAFAQRIIADQEREIAEMRTMLKRLSK